ncbi:MAG TPA: type II secretion system F family protein [Actinomycetota bacterium]|nr:type II secretion system F family protein [Actinomycetota bacterium]
MAEFAYRARDAGGGVRTGTLEADSEVAAVGRIRQEGWLPVQVLEKKTGGVKTEIRIPGIGNKISLKDVAVGSRQLATMINAGLPMLRALTVMTEQTESKPLAKVWNEVRGDVQAGSSFSAALSKHPKAFNGLYVSMVRAGETGGVLDDVLIRVADTLEKAVELRNKIKSAMTYPVMVGALVFVILMAILLFVVPTFQELYAGLGGVLPVPTRILLVISKIVRKFFPFVILAIFGGAFALRRYVATEGGRNHMDILKLKMPVFGELFRKVAMSRFSRTLGVLMRSGVPVLQSLDITSETVQNTVVARAVKDVQNSVREGESLARPLERHKVFPPMVVQMLAVGEETGAVDGMLEKVADFYDAEVDATVDALTSLIEPMLIAFLGVVVGGILISLYLPMFKIVNLIQ